MKIKNLSLKKEDFRIEFYYILLIHIQGHVNLSEADDLNNKLLSLYYTI
jgi:hypothetical protein